MRKSWKDLWNTDANAVIQPARTTTARMIRNAAMLLAVLLFGLAAFACENPVEKRCESVCDMLVRCAEETYGEKASPELAQEAALTCMSGCVENQAQIMPCFQEAEDSCEAMYQCLLKTPLVQ